MVQIVGHRGARNLWAENSLGGFRKLCALGVDAVEFDVHQSADGGIVVIHDPTLDRTTLGHGPVGARPAAKLIATRLRDAEAECIPLLDEVLAVFQDTALDLHIEIKTDVTGAPYAGLERRVIEAVHRRGLERRAMFTCFVPEMLEAVRREWPQARVQASLDRRSAEMMGGLERALERFATIAGCVVAIEQSLLALALPPALEKLGSERVGVWTVNEPDDIANWMHQPIRQITTDRPDLAVAARERAAAR